MTEQTEADRIVLCQHLIALSDAEVIAWGGEPYAQPFMKLNALEKRPHPRFDWTPGLLSKVQRWVNGRYWKYTTFDGYDASARSTRRQAA